MTQSGQECPVDYTKLVEYNPKWRTEHRFFVDEVNWPIVRPRVEVLRRRYPVLSWSLLGHTTEDRPGVRFGCVDKSGHIDVDAERSVAVDLGLAEAVVEDGPKTERQSRYPFVNLREVGDNFLVKNCSHGVRYSISNLCSYWSRRKPGYLYKSMTVEEGTLVILVHTPGVQYDVVMDAVTGEQL